MRGERVVDASVIAAALFLEEFTSEARRFLLETPRLVAPDHLHAEIASVAAKKVWRGETSEEIGAAACAALKDLVATTPSSTLALHAFELAARHRCSADDRAAAIFIKNRLVESWITQPAASPAA
jgi:predicted nucleic acid-binding protein